MNDFSDCRLESSRDANTVHDSTLLEDGKFFNEKFSADLVKVYDISFFSIGLYGSVVSLL